MQLPQRLDIHFPDTVSFPWRIYRSAGCFVAERIERCAAGFFVRDEFISCTLIFGTHGTMCVDLSGNRWRTIFLEKFPSRDTEKLLPVVTSAIE